MEKELRKILQGDLEEERISEILDLFKRTIERKRLETDVVKVGLAYKQTYNQALDDILSSL